MTEAPRVFLIPPQLWSPLGERVDVDGFGRATVETDEGSVQVFPPESREPDSSTRLVAWSPDAGSMILSVTTKKALWVVDRDGSNARQIAAESRGTASWWMDNAGATPHADLTCSVITAGSYACLPGVRGPYDGGETYDFAWAPCPGATGYEIQVLDASGATVFETLIAGSFAHIEKAELPDGELTWRIRAIIGPTPAPWADAQPLVPGASFAAVP